MFLNNSLLKHNSHRCQRALLLIAFVEQDLQFCKPLKQFSIDEVPRAANVIRTPEFEKLNDKSDSSMNLKERITPHDKEHIQAAMFRTLCCLYLPPIVRIVFFVVSFRQQDRCQSDC